MSIKRIERKSFLGPIRINTSSSGASSVGEQVVRFADSQRERHYKVAVAAAENSGKLLAAEADLTSVTNIDQDTGKSEILIILLFSYFRVFVTLSLVVLGLEPIIEVFDLVIALIKVDLPELGKPTSKISGILFLVIFLI